MCVCVCVCACVCVCMRVCVCIILTFIHKYIHTYVHTYIHTYIHTCHQERRRGINRLKAEPACHTRGDERPGLIARVKQGIADRDPCAPISSEYGDPLPT